MAKSRPLTRLQSARAIVESYDDLSPSDIRRLPAVERELYNVALEYIETDVSGRTPRKVSRVPRVAPKLQRKPKTRSRVRGKLPQKVVHRITPKPAKLPSKLKEYLRDLRTPIRRSATALLLQFPELDHMDDLEGLLDDERADDAIEQGNSAEMWFSKSHGSYGGMLKEKQRIEKERRKQEEKEQWEKEQQKKRRKKKQASSPYSKRGLTKKQKISPKKRSKRLMKRRK